jgi:hypothetical protein
MTDGKSRQAVSAIRRASTASRAATVTGANLCDKFD